MSNEERAGQGQAASPAKLLAKEASDLLVNAQHT